jgi:hypothetical protein
MGIIKLKKSMPSSNPQTKMQTSSPKKVIGRKRNLKKIILALLAKFEVKGGQSGSKKQKNLIYKSV